MDWFKIVKTGNAQEKAQDRLRCCQILFDTLDKELMSKPQLRQVISFYAPAIGRAYKEQNCHDLVKSMEELRMKGLTEWAKTISTPQGREVANQELLSIFHTLGRILGQYHSCIDNISSTYIDPSTPNFDFNENFEAEWV